MSFLYNNLAAIAVAAVSAVLVWAFGGTRGDQLITFAPWLLAFMVEVVFFFPQRHGYETTYEARERVWRALKRDPLTWVSLGLLALLLIPCANNGLCPNCDAKTIADGIDPAPPVAFLPFCVNRLDHFEVFLWFALAVLSLTIVRQCLTRHGKVQVLRMIVWNGALVAVLGFVQDVLAAPGPLWCGKAGASDAGTFFATFGYPNMAGDYFTALFAVSLALWRERCERLRLEEMETDESKLAVRPHGAFWRKHFYLIPAAVFFYAALNTLSRAAIILVTSVAVIGFFHTLVISLSRMHRQRRVIVGVWSLLAFGVLIFFAMMFMPKDIRREVDSLGTTEVLDRVTGKGQYHSRVATALWKEHLLFGCGGWGYRHLHLGLLTPEERRELQLVGGANVHNDHLQFLAEHGLVGFGLMLALVALLLAPVCRGWKLMVKDLRFKKGKDLPPKPVQLFVLPAPAFLVLTGVVATAVHAFGDCPLRSPAVLTLFFVELAALPGFMPKLSDGPLPRDPRHSHHHHHHH